MTTAATTVAAFDVDGTLTTRDCVVPFLREVAGTWGLVGGLLRHPLRLFERALRRDRDGLKAMAATAVFAGRNEDEVRRLGTDFARRVHAGWMRQDTVRQLDRHREAGDLVVLVSASFELYLVPLARLIGVDHVLGTRLAAADGAFTGELEGPNCRGPEKVERLRSWMTDEGVERTAITLVAYGDSAGDRDLLAASDEAHWVA